MRPEPLLWLDQIADEDFSVVGGKAFALARLRRLGLPVPDGFVLTAASSLDADRRAALRVAYGRLGGRVAVRSSSTAEDTAEASFAGQYLTVLDVTGEEAVAEAAERCLRSLDATPYARATGARTSDVMAVLVQRFVEPKAAGVVFTRHPREQGALLVESRLGRGDAVVSGNVSPDRYVLDRASHAFKTGPENGSLARCELLSVAALACRAEQALGGPQDVEWALSEEGTHLLQSRPITVSAEEEAPPGVRFLTRANVGEVLPGPVTPLTWTTVGRFLEHAFREVTRTAGLLPASAAPFLVLHRSRLYLNLTLCLDVALRLPGVSRADAEAMILGRGAGGNSGAPRSGRLASLPLTLLRLLRLAGRLDGLLASARRALAALPEPSAIDAADAALLREHLGAFEAAGLRISEAHVATSGATGVRLALLARALPGAKSPGVEDRVNRLVAGLDGVASAAPALAVEELAAEARTRTEWTEWLKGRPPEALATALRRGDAPAALRDRLSAFLGKFGHRAVSEGELAALSWEDDPAPVLGALSAALVSPRSAGFGHRAAAEVRQADEEALMSRLGFTGRAIVGYALGAAREWVARREETKSMAVVLVQCGRRLARAAARRLVAQGALAAEADVFFLSLEELRATLAGSPLPSAAVGRRRRKLLREGTLPAPRDVDLELESATPAASAGEALRGIGVSPGVGVGRVRVLVPGESLELAAGEILVAPVLDAGHGPALAAAAGAVAEIGGMLSHGAVVARELGVPCVVDVREATQRLRTGDLVLVDGGSGQVIPMPETAAKEAASWLHEADPADEGLHALEAHPLARESVYFNAQDETRDIFVVASLGVRRGGRGEALLAIALPDGRLLFGLDLAAARLAPDAFSVAGASVTWSPTRLSFEGRLAEHEAAAFPPPPIPALLAPRTRAVSLNLELTPTIPAFDMSQGLAPEVLEALRPLGRHHLEQSGRWRGEIRVDGRRFGFEGQGARDHSWGLRDWEAADHWRLFTASFGPDLAVHALAVAVGGRLVEGGFLWRAGHAEPVTRVRYSAQRSRGRLASLELEVASAAGPPLQLRGEVRNTLLLPVQLSKNPLHHIAGLPYRMMLHENFTRYETLGRAGLGMAEFTERRFP